VRKYIFISIIIIFTLSILLYQITFNNGLKEGFNANQIPGLFSHKYLTENGFEFYHHDYLRVNDNIETYININDKIFNDTVTVTLRSSMYDVPYFFKFDISVNSMQDSLLLNFLGNPPDSTCIRDYVDAFNVQVNYYNTHEKKYYITRSVSEDGVGYGFRPKTIISDNIFGKIKLIYLRIVIFIYHAIQIF